VASRILLPIVNTRRALSLLTLAEALLQTGVEQIVLAGMVGVPPDEPLSKGTNRARTRRRELASLAAQKSHLPLEVDPHVRVTHDLLDDLLALLHEHTCDTVILELIEDCALELPVDQVISRLECRIIFQSGALPAAPIRILLPSRGGEHAGHTLHLASALSGAIGGEITLVHAATVFDGSQPPPGEMHPDLSLPAAVTREINLRGTMAELIETLTEEQPEHQLLILGTPAHHATHGEFGARTRLILKAVPLPAVVVHAPVELQAPLVRRIAPSFSVNVDKWFAENTFDANEFSDLNRLVSLKKAQRLTVSLGLPALNEEETIGKVITTVRDNLMERYPLVDEIVLIDSNSTDSTVEIARSLGVSVFRHADILPELGSYRGKGEALWKSLHVLQGDIIAWIDTDIVNIHPRFIYGLLGPLLASPRVKYVKGFYRRPLRVGDKLQAGGGGRVTELVVRPLLNLYFPELSGLVQPLSGEYAGRREVLERIPFFSGYAVETGMLIDILGQFGLAAIAQVDLRERIHHNQPLAALSKMSFVIIQALLSRLDEHRLVDMLVEPSRSMKLVSDDDGRLSLDIEELEDIERPPMAAVPAYREQRRALRRETARNGTRGS
jgi:glucosyl-3-phosphoglycerate synthase